MSTSTHLPTLPSPRTLLAWSIAVAVVTIVLKTLAWYVTDSVGLLSDAMESFVNLASAIVALILVTVANQPADDNHPYGHHKAEYFSSIFEGVLIIGASLGIIWAALHRLWDPQPLESVGLGLALSVISSALNGGLAWLMFRSAKVYRSIALEADARHLVTDVWTSVGVVIGIGAVGLTGWLWLDAVVAIGVALNILREGFGLVWRSSQGLMDESLDTDSQAAISAVLQRFVGEQRARHGREGLLRFDHLASRRAGQRCFVDMHMHMPAQWTLGEAADLRGQVERALMAAVPGLRATIELLPSDVEAHFDDSVDAPVAQVQPAQD